MQILKQSIAIYETREDGNKLGFLSILINLIIQF